MVPGKKKKKKLIILLPWCGSFNFHRILKNKGHLHVFLTMPLGYHDSCHVRCPVGHVWSLGSGVNGKQASFVQSFIYLFI